jgi:UDP-glucose 4-epimerase
MTLHGRNAVVTGGAGFIGSELVRQALDAGAHVTVVDNLSNGKQANLAGLDGARLKLVIEDIRNRDCLSGLLHHADVVFHLACLGVRHSIHAPRENHDVNATATLDLLILARASGAKRFVHISSSEVYGNAVRVPMTEEHPTRPRTVYGAGKLAGECYARVFWQTYAYPTVIVRPFNTFGPRCHHEGDCGEVIPKFLLRAMAGEPLVIFGDGMQTRDFSFVSDVARGILAAGMSERALGRTINIGSGREVSINDLARDIAGLAGKATAKIIHDEPRPGDVRRLCADVAKARDLLDYQPSVGLSDGLGRLRDWYAGLSRPIDALLREEVVHNWRPKSS